MTKTPPNLLRHDSFQRCLALLDYIEDEQKIRDDEGLSAWLARNVELGEYFWRQVAYWWPFMDAIEHENMAMFFDHFSQEWSPDCMGETDRRSWNSLPRKSQITVYRGQDETLPVGLAWTTNRRKAEWFANAGLRGYRKSSPVILTAKLWKWDIALRLTGRGESEVVPFEIPTNYTAEQFFPDVKQAA